MLHDVGHVARELMGGEATRSSSGGQSSPAEQSPSSPKPSSIYSILGFANNSKVSRSSSSLRTRRFAVMKQHLVLKRHTGGYMRFAGDGVQIETKRSLDLARNKVMSFLFWQFVSVH